MKTNMKRLLSLLVLIALCTLTAYAEGTGVSVMVGNPVYTDSGITLTVETQFHDPALYNEQIALSYHIYGLEGNLLVFENERFPVEVDETGTAHNDVVIHFTAIPELEDLQQAEVRFDLVDQKNIFWFSDNQSISFQFASVLFDRGNLLPADSADQKATFSAATMISALLCVAGWGVLLYFLRKYAKSPTTHNQQVVPPPLDE